MNDEVMEEMTIEEQIISILDVVRPYLNNDGGDVQFVKFEDGICYVRLTGACAGCMSMDVTLNDGIKDILVENIPGIVEVVNVTDQEF